MYNQTQAQKDSEQALIKQGFRFDNWISAQTENDSEGCMVFSKRGATKYGKEYREIALDGSIN